MHGIREALLELKRFGRHRPQAGTVGVIAVALVMVGACATGAAAQQNRGASVYLGLSGSNLLEAWEGSSGSARFGGGVAGVNFNERWSVRVEFGPTFEMCDDDVPIAGGGGATRGLCHDHSQLFPRVIRRFSGNSPYLLLGLNPGLDVGLGWRVPLGPRFGLATEIDVYYAGDAIGIFLPKLLFTARL